MTNLERMAVMTSIACVIKFLIDGVTISYAGHTMDFGHMDAMSYATLLGPLWGSHAYVAVSKIKAASNGNKE